MIEIVDNAQAPEHEDPCPSPWGILNSVLDDYGIETDSITDWIGERLVDEFMEKMSRAGYV